MSRSDPSRTLLLALGLLLVMLGLSVPLPVAVAGSSIDNPLTGRAEIVSQLTHNQAVARPDQPVRAAPGGFVAVLPATAVVPMGLVHGPKIDAFHDGSAAAGPSTRSVRAPPVSAA